MSACGERGNGCGTGSAASRRHAERIALSNRNDSAADCSVNYWVCTTP